MMIILIDLFVTAVKSLPDEQNPHPASSSLSINIPVVG